MFLVVLGWWLDSIILHVFSVCHKSAGKINPLGKVEKKATNVVVATSQLLLP